MHVLSSWAFYIIQEGDLVGLTWNCVLAEVTWWSCLLWGFATALHCLIVFMDF